MKISDVLLRLIGARDPNCPNEAEVLAYSENRLSARNRARIERHFANCHDCRQVLAFLAREFEETSAPLNEEAVSEQTHRVLAYIQTDEHNRRPVQKPRSTAGFYISYPRLASVGLVICAIAAAGIFLITRDQSPADAAMAALRLGLKDSRYTEARISGGFEHSRRAGPTRGGDSDNKELHLDRAENLLKAAAQEPSAVEDRLVSARIYLARGTPPDARQALAILDQLAKNGVETPEALNDTGVAHLILSHYPEAITWFSKALTKSPAYYEALFNRALAEELTHRNDEDARRDWQTFIEKSSGDNWRNEAREHLTRLNNSIR